MNYSESEWAAQHVTGGRRRTFRLRFRGRFAGSTLATLDDAAFALLRIGG